MDAFHLQLIERLPLASAVLETFRFAFDDELLERVYERHRGHGYTGTLRFGAFVGLVRDCLLEHGGSGHRLCVARERRGTLPVDESSFYRKLARMPVPVSRALLRECTARLGELVEPHAALLPGCFEPFAVVVLDGKKVKRAAKRLKPTRGYGGALLGAKALVAMSLRSGLALAMSDALDGEANDVPLVPELLPQVRAVSGAKPILWMADRQFGDGHVPRQLAERPGDHFVLRVRKGLRFQADPACPARRFTDEHGRAVIDEIGTFGTGKHAMRLRRVTLLRPAAEAEPEAEAEAGGDDVALITDLLEQSPFDARDLLKLYRRRWGIEQMFQQVTETFALDHLIGCTPRAVLFQVAFCLLMYNLVQVLKAYVAADGRVDRSLVSTANLFYDVRRELSTWSYLAAAAALPAISAAPDAASMRARLRALLVGSWDAVAYLKASDKRPRKKRPKPKRLHGGHTSVQRLLDGRVKLRT
jgi:hypothetical protein